MKRVLAIILGGGAGTRLYPLTKLRAKPAVPLGAKYRLIDIPISNCINSEIQRIYVLTQFNSASLNRHIARTYAMAGAGFSQGFVEVLAAQQTQESPSWFEGTADAVRKYLWLFAEWDVDQYLILSGDHLYRMNYADFIQRHRETKADITLSVVPVDEQARIGLRIDEDRQQRTRNVLQRKAQRRRAQNDASGYDRARTVPASSAANLPTSLRWASMFSRKRCCTIY